MYRVDDQLVGKTSGRIYTKVVGHGMLNMPPDHKFSALERSHYPHTRCTTLYYDYMEGS